MVAQGHMVNHWKTRQALTALWDKGTESHTRCSALFWGAGGETASVPTTHCKAGSLAAPPPASSGSQEASPDSYGMSRGSLLKPRGPS